MSESKYPALYVEADRLSNKSQTAFFCALFANLIAIVSSTVAFSAFAETKLRVGFALVCLLVSLAAIAFIAINRPLQTWYRARALSESIKTITWRFMMRAEPFDEVEDISQRHFTTTLRKLLEDNSNLKIAASDQVQITQEMKDTRHNDLAGRKHVYELQRIREQQTWYFKRSRRNKRAADLWFLSIVFVHIAVIFILISNLADFSSPTWLVEGLLALAAALVTWTQAKRFQDLSASYSLAAHDIGFVREQSQSEMTEPQFSHFVGDAENAFSREHTQWRARIDT